MRKAAQKIVYLIISFAGPIFLSYEKENIVALRIMCNNLKVFFHIFYTSIYFVLEGSVEYPDPS